MSNESFVAFWAGVCIGLIVGISMSAVLVAVSNKIEGGEKK